MSPTPSRAELMRELSDVLARAADLTAQVAALDLAAAPTRSNTGDVVMLKVAARTLGVHVDTVWTRAVRLGVARQVGGPGGRRVVDLAVLLADARGHELR